MRYDNLYEHSTVLPDNRGHYRRTRIDKLLSEALGHPLVTIIAGAGLGKTQAVSSFLRHADLSFMWMQLSPLDNYTVRFWESFSHAVSTFDAALAAKLELTKFPDSDALFHEYLHIVADTLGTKKLVLVFDDIHLISRPAILRFLEKLLHARLRNVTVILSGRELPQLDIRGDFRIAGDDLLFTEAEAEEYLGTQGIQLLGDDLWGVYNETGGWAAALYLAGLSLKKNTAGDGLTAAKMQIFEMIEQEIFSTYPPIMQRGLIKMSFFEKIPYEVLRDYRELHDEVKKSNLFIRYNPVTQTYDIHNLFLKFLRKKQELLTAGELEDIHFKLACWYQSHGFALEALTHFDKCGRYEKIWEIISHYYIELPVGIAGLFLELMGKFPESFAETYPLIPVVHARLLLNNGHRVAAEREFLDIIRAYDNNPSESGRTAAGEAYIFMGMISLFSYDYRFVDYYKKADEHLPGGSSLIDGRFTFSKGNYMVLIDDPSPGELRRHVDMAMEAMPYAVRAMNGAAYGVKYVIKAAAAYATGDMKEAEMSAYKAIYQAEQNAQYDTICAAYFVLVRIHLYAGHYEKAAACIDDVRERLANAQNAAYVDNSIYMRDIMTGWYYSKLGDFEKVPDWILKKEKRDQLMPDRPGRDPLIRAYCLLATESYYELSAFLDTLEKHYDARRLLIARVEVQVFKAIVAHKIGDIPASMAALETAYNLSAGNELFMPFIEMGKYMRAVIYTAKREEKLGVPPEWLDMVYTKAATYEKHLRNARASYGQTEKNRGPAILEHLTRREKEILRYLCQGLTTIEIAGQMYISTSAVKKSLGIIYGKLGAANRTEAVRIATSLPANPEYGGKLR